MSRIKNLIAALLFALLPILSTPAHAVENAMDAVPGATVLYPYFEVDLASPTGATTLLSVSNTSATAIMVNVTVWSDWGTPVISFPIYLTGYDVQTWNMRDIVSLGVFPRTASAGQDPTDTISNHGPLSQDINFASCTGTLPLANMSAPTLAAVQAALTGTAVTGLTGITNGTCVSRAYGDQVARGYVTADTVTQCNGGTPATAGYFAGVITHQNVMWGDYMLINPTTNTAQGGLATMLESKGYFASPYVAGDYTFYGRFNTFLASDQREALAAHWIVHGDTDSTRVVAWRDPKTNTGMTGVACGTTPANQPLPKAYAHAVWTDSFATDVSANATFGSALSSLSLTSGAPLNLTAAKKLGFFALGLEPALVVSPTPADYAQALVLPIRQTRANGTLATPAVAFPVQQVMSPNAGFGRVVN